MAGQVGNRWCKCDLHLHTMSSACYLEKTDTPHQWIARAKEQGLDAVAVTDHNDYRGIPAMMEEGKKQGVAVFPGVEITCDSTKIHMLIIFNTDKNADTVRDFLNRCDIYSENIGQSEGTNLSVFEVCKIAKKRGALVIAAHIDEFNSINSMNPANLDRIMEEGYIDAVQVTNVPVWEKYQSDKNAGEMYESLRKKYGPDASESEIEKWRKCYDRAVAAQLPMLSFSDNPHSPEESRHGLWGIGSVYTWIQMDDTIDLDSLRQSLISHDSRIRMKFESETSPKTEPDFWIKYLEVRKTMLNPYQNIHLDFHPQLNIIIGGRGSGKSSIIRLFCGVYQQLSGTFLSEAFCQQEDFYSTAGDQTGIFQKDSEIEIVFKWYGYTYKMLVTDIKSVNDQKYSLSMIDGFSGNEEIDSKYRNISLYGFKTLMSGQVFVQHQIFDIARTPGALLDQVDRSIPDMYIMKNLKDFYFREVVNSALEKRALEIVLADGPRVLTEHAWIENLLEEERKNTITDTDHEAGKNKETAGPKEEFDLQALLKRRDGALCVMDDCINQLNIINTKQTQAIKKYEDILEEIRKVRTEFLRKVLKDDENYKMEMMPCADRVSFYHGIAEIIKCDPKMIKSDLKKIEDTLFAKKDGIKNYQNLIKEVKKISESPNSADNDGKNTYSDYFLHLMKNLREIDYQRLLYFHPEDALVSYHHPNGVKRFFPMDKASSGEKVAAVLSYALASSAVPLMIDQPEDDCDNRIIYEEIVKKLKRIKKKRQMILATHSANIAANADAEMIIAMDSHSKFTKVGLQGTMDQQEMRHAVCDILEGTEEAFFKRTKKYHMQEN